MTTTEPNDRDIEEIYLECRRQGMGERQAARFLGTTHREIQQYATMNDDFRLRLEDALAERLEMAEHRAWQAAHDGDPAMLKATLESHNPAEWTKPTPDMILKVQRDVDEIDVPDLLKRLQAAQRQQELRERSIETTATEGDSNASDL